MRLGKGMGAVTAIEGKLGVPPASDQPTLWASSNVVGIIIG